MEEYVLEAKESIQPSVVRAHSIFGPTIIFPYIFSVMYFPNRRFRVHRVSANVMINPVKIGVHGIF